MKRIGFLSFGYWSDAYGSKVASATDSLSQSVDLAVAADELGIDGAYFRVHHFAEQLSSPIPLLATIAAKTHHINVGTGVIDMRYATPLALAEDAAALDLLSGGRVQLGVGRGSPERADRGYEQFGHVPDTGQSPTNLALEHTERFLTAIDGRPIAAEPRSTRATLPVTPLAPGLRERVLWGAGKRDTAVWAARHGLQLMSSTLITEEKGMPFTDLQLEQIDGFRSTWAEAGWPWQPAVTVVRSVVALVDDLSRAVFAPGPQNMEGIGELGGIRYRYGATFVGEPDQLVEQLRADRALAAADTVLIAIPNQLGVDYNIRQLAALKQIGAELGWNG